MQCCGRHHGVELVAGEKDVPETQGLIDGHIHGKVLKADGRC